MIHILNGDSLASQFSESIPGAKIIVREALIDGPVKADSLEEFWIRYTAFAGLRSFVASPLPLDDVLC